jgi:hypothetical protein
MPNCGNRLCPVSFLEIMRRESQKTVQYITSSFSIVNLADLRGTRTSPHSSHHDMLPNLLACLLISLLCFLLLRRQEVCNPLESIGCNLYLRAPQCLGERDNSLILTSLLLLFLKSFEHVLFALCAELKWKESYACDLLLKGRGLLLDDRHTGVELRQTLVTEGVSLSEVRCDVAVWPFEVRLDWDEEALVCIESD